MCKVHNLKIDVWGFGGLFGCCYNADMTTKTDRQSIRIGHSPDPDDAFMWYPLANFPDGSGPGGKTYTPKIDTDKYDFVHILEDIQSLNERAEKAELEITAVSIHQYPYICKDYALTSCGSSMGDGYGPMLVSPTDFKLADVKGKRIAIPGLQDDCMVGVSVGA